MNLRSGLKRLGDPTGKSEMDFVRALKRKPVAISEMAHGMRLLQWRTGRYQIQSIAVLFDANHRFVKISSRYQV